MASLMGVLLLLPPLGMEQAAPREPDRDRQERLYYDRDGLAFRGSDRDGEDRADEGQESARDVQKERAEVERELRQAAAERDRALEKADAEAAREGQAVKLRQQQTAIWEQYEAKRYNILTRFEDKRDQ
jgi:hypothetical protein